MLAVRKNSVDCIVDRVHAFVVDPPHDLSCEQALVGRPTVATAFGGSTVQEQVGHLTRHDPFGCDQNQFYMFIAYLVHQVSCIHCVFHCREGDEEACLYGWVQSLDWTTGLDYWTGLLDSPKL